MIEVLLNKPEFEYDIHSLVKAFYPQHDVLVKAMPREEFPESVFHLVVNYDRKNHMIDFKFYERPIVFVHQRAEIESHLRLKITDRVQIAIGELGGEIRGTQFEQ